MFVPFDTLPDSAKIWVYQADKVLGLSQQEIIKAQLKAFTDKWLVHGAPLEASFDLRFDQFVVLAANDTASGCSIDTSVHLMKAIGEITSIDFFNRNLLAFRNGDKTDMIALSELKGAIAEGKCTENSLFFNNAVSTISEFNTAWLAEAGKTWLKRYFLKTTVTK